MLFLPNSPRLLVMHGKLDEARQVLHQIRYRAPSFDDDVIITNHNDHDDDDDTEVVGEDTEISVEMPRDGGHVQTTHGDDRVARTGVHTSVSTGGGGGGGGGSSSDRDDEATKSNHSVVVAVHNVDTDHFIELELERIQSEVCSGGGLMLILLCLVFVLLE